MGAVVNLADYREAAKLPLPAPSAEYSTAAFLEKYVKPASEWSRGWSDVHLSDYVRNAGFWRYKIAGQDHGKDSDAARYEKALWEQAEKDHEWFLITQLFIAAPHIHAYRWKQKYAKRFRHPEITAALARDALALAPQLARIAKQQAGKARAKAARQAAQL